MFSRVLRRMAKIGENKEYIFTPAIFDYIQSNSLRPHPQKEAIRNETSKRFPNDMIMLGQNLQGEMMEMMVQSMNAKKCLEVGTFTGYSSLCIALGLPTGGKLYTLDVSQEFASLGAKYWKEAGVQDKIELIIAPALESLNKFIQENHAGTFDFAFVDAEKSEYVQYYDAIIQLLRPGGTMLIDNVIWSGKVIDSSVNDASTVGIRNITQHVKNDPRVKTIILPFADGIQQVVKL